MCLQQERFPCLGTRNIISAVYFGTTNTGSPQEEKNVNNIHPPATVAIYIGVLPALNFET